MWCILEYWHQIIYSTWEATGKVTGYFYVVLNFAENWKLGHHSEELDMLCVSCSWGRPEFAFVKKYAC